MQTMSSLKLPKAHELWLAIEAEVEQAVKANGGDIREMDMDGLVFVHEGQRFKISLKQIKTKQ